MADVSHCLAVLKESFDSAPFAVWVRDREGRVVFENAQVARYWGRQVGLTPEESGATAEVVAAWKAANREGYAGRVSCSEHEFRTRDHEVRRFQNIVTPLRLGGRVLGVMGFLVDLTGQRSTEDALSQSEERYRLMVEAIPMMAWQCDAHGGLIEANSRWYAYTGQTIGEARGNGWMMALHPDDRSRVAQTVLDDVKGGIIYQTEYRLRRASDGEYRWHVARALPVCDAAGEIKAWFGAAADIHVQKSAEEQLEGRIAERTRLLRDTEARLSRVLDGSNDGYWEWDVVADRVSMSRRCRVILGFPGSTDFAARADVRRHIHPDDLAAVTATVEACIRNQSGSDYYSFEHRQYREDGAVVWVHTRGVVLRRDDSGKAVSISGMVTDITERKRAEEELRQRSRQLAQLASDLAVSEQRERRRLAELLHDNVQQLLVAARIQALAMEAGHGRVDRGALTRLHGVLEQAVASSRAITRDLAPPVSLHKDLSAALKWLAREMKERHQLTVAVRVPPQSVHAAEAANVLLFTAARELLLNVVKHAGCGKASVSLRRRRDGLELTVADRGRGISPDLSRKPGNGYGFGLFSIRERAELVGGTLTVQSEVGHGTRVTVKLPAPMTATSASAGTETGGRDAAPPSCTTPARKRAMVPDARLRVVFADDHQAVREGLISLLRAEPAVTVVGEAGNGKEAIACVERLRPDVVVMDVSMPVMDGVEATRQIVRRWPRVRVIGLSMYDDADIVRRMKEAGASDYVTKSASPERLVGAIRGRES